MAKMIDSAEERDGLYHPISQEWESWAYQVEGGLTREHEIRL